jgi:hypothetical protein
MLQEIKSKNVGGTSATHDMSDPSLRRKAIMEESMYQVVPCLIGGVYNRRGNRYTGRRPVEEIMDTNLTCNRAHPRSRHLATVCNVVR